jgi:hypothetical protein
MRIPTLAAFTVAATAVMGATSAFAIPTSCYDGICVPSTGAYIDNSKSWETLVTKTNDILSGVFKVTDIGDNLGNTTYGGYGFGGHFLGGVFDGFKLIDPSTTPGQLWFTGGTLKYYSSTVDHFSTTGGSAGTDEALMASGNLWASFDAKADSLGRTLVITLGGTPTNFTGASTDDVFLDVNLSVPSAAGLAFDSNTMLDTNNILRDLKFSGTASGYNGTPCTPDFQICGANTAKGFLIPVPEPVTLSLFGAGLAGAAAMRRRKAKKA